MDGMQSQFLSNSSNFDVVDPTGLLTYLINENESGASIVPVPGPQQQQLPPSTTTTSSMVHHQQHHSQQQHGYNSNNIRSNNLGQYQQQQQQNMHHQQQQIHHHQQHMSHHHQQQQHHHQQQQQLFSPHHHQQQQQMHHHQQQQHHHLVNSGNNLTSPGSGSNSNNNNHRQHQQQQLASSQFSPNSSNNINNGSNQVMYSPSPSGASVTSPASSVASSNPRSNQGNASFHFDNNTNSVTSAPSTPNPISPSIVPSPGMVGTAPQGSSPPSKIFSDTLSETGHLITPRKENLVIVSNVADEEVPIPSSASVTDIKSLPSPPERSRTAALPSPRSASGTKVRPPGHRGPGRPRKIRPEEQMPQKMDVDDRLNSSATPGDSSSSSVPKVGGSMAQKKTIIVLKIVDQIILNGKVVQESEKEEKFERFGGFIDWPSTSNNSLTATVNCQNDDQRRRSSPLPSTSTKGRHGSGHHQEKVSTKVSTTTTTTTIPSPPKMKDVLTHASSRFRTTSSDRRSVHSSASVPKDDPESASGVERAREKRREESSNKRRSNSSHKSNSHVHGSSSSSRSRESSAVKRNRTSTATAASISNNHDDGDESSSLKSRSSVNVSNLSSYHIPKIKSERIDSNETTENDDVDDGHDDDDDDRDMEQRMRETASTLLILQSSPNKIDPDSRHPSSSNDDRSNMSKLSTATDGHHRRDVQDEDSNNVNLDDDANSCASKDVHQSEDGDGHQMDTNVTIQYDYREVVFEPLKVGSHVMAKWSDKNFYAGKLVKNMSEYRWNILFEDGGKKVVHESDIISIPYLTIGQIVMITFSGQGLCLRGTIKDVVVDMNNNNNNNNNQKSRTSIKKSGHQQMFYVVEYSVDGSKLVTDKFCRGDVFLTADLAAPLLSRQSKSIVHQPDSNAKFADVDLNNIIPKRSRVSAQAKAESTEKGSSGANKSVDTTHIHHSVSTDNESETESINSNKSSSKKSGKKLTMSSVRGASHSPKVSKNVDTIDTTSQSSLHSNHSLSSSSSASKLLDNSKSMSTNQGRPTDEGRKSVSTSIKDATSKSSSSIDCPLTSSLASKLPSDELIDLLGPVPEEGSSLFQGIAFLLTTADQNAATKCVDGRSRGAPFDIYYLMKQIEAGGGRVYQQLNEAQDSPDCKEIVLLAYTYLRTVKYMQCLAAGIPCLMHTFVVDCCKQGTLLPKEDYLLPSGFSITTNSLPSDRMVFKKSATLFEGVRFMLVSKNSRHSESWTPVLNAANAVVVDDLPASPGTATRKASNAVDVIISDASCPSHIMKKAKQLKIPIVSSEYVVQCLINGKRLPFDAHEKFDINYKS